MGQRACQISLVSCDGTWDHVKYSLDKLNDVIRNSLVYELLEKQALTIYQYGPHPLLGDGILDHQFFWFLQDIHRRFSMNDGHV
jgi:hypothetical protein